MDITFLTTPDAPMSDSDILTLKALEEKNVSARFTPWDTPLETLEKTDLLMLKTVGGYYKMAEAFEAFLDKTKTFSTPIQNSPSLVHWNMHKTYLKALEEKQVPIIETVWIDKGTDCDLAALLAKKGWKKAVLKPIISAGSFNTWKLSPETLARVEKPFLETLPKAGYMLQPFMEKIITEGEWSLIFFNNIFSHGLLKKPTQGDFRVQKQHGGAYTPARPSEEMLAIATHALSQLPEAPLYARVDGVNTENGFRIMEVELIEPDLYFDFVPECLPNYINALLATHSRRGT